MTAPKRKIKAKHFVRDLRNGMGDRDLMEKYAVSEIQLHKLMHKLMDVGALDEMELFMRTYLSDGFMAGTFGGTQCAREEMGYRRKTVSRPGLEPPSDISITEKVNTTSGTFRCMLAKPGKTGSSV